MSLCWINIELFGLNSEKFKIWTRNLWFNSNYCGCLTILNTLEFNLKYHGCIIIYLTICFCSFAVIVGETCSDFVWSWVLGQTTCLQGSVENSGRRAQFLLLVGKRHGQIRVHQAAAFILNARIDLSGQISFRVTFIDKTQVGQHVMMTIRWIHPQHLPSYFTVAFVDFVGAVTANNSNSIGGGR